MKRRRQQTILQLVENKVLLTQEDLQNELQNAGFRVTQSTVSRDIKELKLVKSTDKSGNYRYFAHKPNETSHTDNQYENMFTGAVKSVDYALNNVVIKCFGGMASGACVAVDSLFGDKMLGSLAGDDTIIIVTRSEEDSRELALGLKNLL